MPQTNSAQISEQPSTPENLHALFQQLCFSYGSLGLIENNATQDQYELYKFFSEDAQALADIALEIYNANGGV